MVYRSSVSGCAFYCLRTEHCKSIGFVSTSGRCELMFGTERQNSNETTFIEVLGLKYYDAKKKSPAMCLYPDSLTFPLLLGTDNMFSGVNATWSSFAKSHTFELIAMDSVSAFCHDAEQSRWIQLCVCLWTRKVRAVSLRMSSQG
ncbi:PREDICTED: uncharacterized protein LOC106811249 [Priapulus caudatus]|uniref:Uncharacterized protein LOC106811249 n=1 Tax=Priapulus caudatus TaxID=37621 RepID=A0ABM1EDM0_PRICU|nr:PREDICTED: uncharacterized protein LOC106811249 [Priapulus caudatus]